MRKLFPTFKPGERRTNRAAAWASLARAAQLGDGLRVSQGMYLARTEHGLHVGTYPPRVVTPIRKSAVFVCGITVKPGDNDTTVSVREVRYKDGVEGPIADTDRPYEFAGDALDALPFPGRKAKEYADFVLSAPGPGDPAGALPLKPTDDYFEAFTFGNIVIVGDIPSESGDTSKEFVIDSIGDESLMAHDPDDVTPENPHPEPLAILKPRGFRKSENDALAQDGFVYTWVSPQRRRLQRIGSVLQENHRIMPEYRIGEIITATKRKGDWVDLNTDKTKIWARDPGDWT